MGKKANMRKGGSCFVKVVKNKAYFKRYQVKFRRRREGKTDFFARKRLVTQDKNKYMSPKYRLVVRFSNKDVCVQVTSAKIIGDDVLTAAYSHELPEKYGAKKCGLTNYAAAYATGLLAARRLLNKVGLDSMYTGKTEADGEMFYVDEEEEGEKRPFKALLDVGLKRTTTGAKVFAAMKGAADGGLNVPHNEKRLVGFDTESKELDTDVLKAHIYGGHVADYMRELQEEDPEQYEKRFSQYIKNGLNADSLEAHWKKVHAAIRKSPAHVKKPSNADKKVNYGRKRCSRAQRKARIQQKKDWAAKKKAEDAEGDDDDEDEE